MIKSTLTLTPEEFEAGNWLLTISTTNPRNKGEVIEMRTRYKNEPPNEEILHKNKQFEVKAANYIADWVPSKQVQFKFSGV